MFFKIIYFIFTLIRLDTEAWFIIKFISSTLNKLFTLCEEYSTSGINMVDWNNE